MFEFKIDDSNNVNTFPAKNQADPFAGVSLTGEWLRFYEEVFPPNMQDSYYTYAWVKECWGEEEAQKMAKAVVICSGGTMATPGSNSFVLHAAAPPPRLPAPTKRQPTRPEPNY